MPAEGFGGGPNISRQGKPPRQELRAATATVVGIAGRAGELELAIAAYAAGCSPTSHNLSVSIWFVFMTASSYLQSYRSHDGDIETHAAKLRAASQQRQALA
jgi:hypothetical protein